MLLLVACCSSLKRKKHSMAMQTETKSACVTGGSGYIASELIKQLLLKGYGVKTTVRDPDNAAKISHFEELRRLGALQVYRAELSEEGSFDEAVAGCEYVFLVAAPVNAFSENPEEELIKPASKGTLNVMKSCVKAKSVKRIVLTSSAAAVSLTPLEGIGHVLDEESWSDIAYLQTEKPPSWGYAVSKVVAEKEASKFAQENNISLVTVLPVLTVGPSLIAEARFSLALCLALLSGNEELINGLKIMETLSGSISLVHVEDICRAHIFVAESPSALGRYICCSVNTGLVELAGSLQQRYPQYKVPTNFGGIPAKAKLSLSSEKLLKAGFEFKFKKLEEIYDDVIEYAKAKGLLP